MLHRPVNDELFNSFTALDWSYYAAQFSLDQEEDLERKRDLAEYQAMFTNPEGVKKVQELRENKGDDILEFEEHDDGTAKRVTSGSDESFAQFIAAGNGGKVPQFKKR